MTTDAAAEQPATDLRDELRALLPPGTTVWAVECSGSRSGKHYSAVFFVVRSGIAVPITARIADALGWGYTYDGGRLVLSRREDALGALACALWGADAPAFPVVWL